MADILVVAEMPMIGAEAGQKAVNSFAFHKEGAYVSGDAASLFVDVRTFFNLGNQGGTGTVADYLSVTLDRTTDAATLKAYDITGKLDGSPHGSPIYEEPMTLDNAIDGFSMPSQVAACVTLRARDALSFPVEAPDSADEGTAIDRPRARRTGRLYLGPLQQDAVARPGGGYVTLSPTFRTIALNACEGLQDSANAHGWAWCVWSRANEAMSVITRAEIDDSPDVIRRRKISATARDARVFSPVPDLALGA